jgi:hypothetical protein
MGYSRNQSTLAVLHPGPVLTLGSKKSGKPLAPPAGLPSSPRPAKRAPGSAKMGVPRSSWPSRGPPYPGSSPGAGLGPEGLGPGSGPLPPELVARLARVASRRWCASYCKARLSGERYGAGVQGKRRPELARLATCSWTASHLKQRQKRDIRNKLAILRGPGLYYSIRTGIHGWSTSIWVWLCGSLVV